MGAWPSCLRRNDSTSDTTGTHWLQEEIPKHAACGAGCSLRHVLFKLDSAAAVDISLETNLKIISDATQIANAIARALKEVDPVWSCTVEQRGSTTNGLKTGRLDEVDFLMKLQNIGVSEDEGWTLVSDEEGMFDDILGSRRGFSLDSNTQIVRSCNIRTPLQSRNNPFVEAKTFFNAQEVKKQFNSALSSAVKKICQATNANASGTVMKFTFHDSRQIFLYYPSEVPYAVKLDITPCAHFTDTTNDRLYWLVPKLSLKNWQHINDDPEDLRSSTVGQAVRVIKVLRNIKGVDEADSVGEKNIYIVADDSSGDRFLEYYLSRFISQLCREQVMGKLSTSLASYPILGTVVQHYRKNKHQTLCSLVLNSVLNFLFVHPDGKPICGLTRGRSYPIRDLYIILRQLLQTENTELNGEISAILPRFYTCEPFLEQYLTASKSPVWSESYHNSAESDVSADALWEVYHIDRQKFAKFLQEETSRTEKYDLSISSYKAKCLIYSARLALRELEEVEENRERRHLSLGILKFKDGIVCLKNVYSFPVLNIFGGVIQVLREGMPTTSNAFNDFYRICGENGRFIQFKTFKSDNDSSS